MGLIKLMTISGGCYQRFMTLSGFTRLYLFFKARIIRCEYIKSVVKTTNLTNSYKLRPIPMWQSFLKIIKLKWKTAATGWLIHICDEHSALLGLEQCCPTLSPFATCGDRSFKCGDSFFSKSYILVKRSIKFRLYSTFLSIVATAKSLSPQKWRICQQEHFG